MKYEGMTYPACLGGVLPSWYLILTGCGSVTSTVYVTAEQMLLHVVGLHIVTSEQEEKMKIYVIGSVVIFHLKSGESHSEQISKGLGGNQAL